MNVQSKPVVRRDDKEIAILDATLRVAASQGLHDTPMARIAGEAGVSVGTVYHYFAGKEELLQALFRRIKTELGPALLAGVNLDEPWPSLLPRIWINAYHYYIARPEATLFLEQYENLHLRKMTDLATLGPEFAALADLIGVGIATGRLRALPLVVFHDLTLGVAVSLAKRHIAGALTLDERELSRVAAICCDTVLA